LIEIERAGNCADSQPVGSGQLEKIIRGNHRTGAAYVIDDDIGMAWNILWQVARDQTTHLILSVACAAADDDS
jgi:hypothetical protein